MMRAPFRRACSLGAGARVRTMPFKFPPPPSVTATKRALRQRSKQKTNLAHMPWMFLDSSPAIPSRERQVPRVVETCHYIGAVDVVASRSVGATTSCVFVRALMNGRSTT